MKGGLKKINFMKMHSLQSKKGASGATMAMVAIAIAAVVIAGMLVYTNFGPTTQTALGGSTSGGTNPAVNPTATYSTKDKFSTSIISGTSYYANDGLPATTSVISNVNPGVKYTYWVDNASTYVKPLVFTASTLNNNIVNQEALLNGTATTSLYDTDNRQTVTNGVYNTSVGIGGVANIEISYQGVAKKSFMPFGGVMIVEKNNSFNVNGGVVCSGANLAANTGSDAFTVTYTPSSVDANTVVYKVLPTIDDGANVNTKKVNCQFQESTGVDAAGAYKVTFIPANYYVTNDGKFALDTEQVANGLTTRTGKGQITLTGYFS